ncbi:phosphatase PAP2 family protein [Staphylococcus schweitzeri]|uniref:Phosphatase PAP2 family protein n=1 Tax=Staphylococcus schweitzeri TaxID=1654388 RepID=A0A2K4AHJ6_9STAP|nr:phosphatase PAP2 family protein [Staphylococcus schweitzeri]MBE2128200.1 phosphatase PAP2 family protein [Staphylococcus schweitzeri]PNZ49591.1 phosphatase PAP2 family protein [Staphylococcus schweitzeri]CDR27444.1 type 2 phosphatidic acid phosphatase family protein [Staphylococcus schweitzeri]CDR50225.1 type 2 phosphatidic acid phosphatase family protein [Staphylococcus schweitzeri]CDR54484.1 type 2 phosphatidic acid phosphatase family protein [Staphylococcus schweitzeri]
MSQWKRISLLIVFTLVFGIIAFFHESRLGKWIDNEVYEFIYASESFITTSIMLGATKVGEVWAMLCISLLLVAYLMLKRHKIEALFFALTMALSGILNPALKNIFDRERPTLLRLIDITGFSFPSGHAMGSTAYFGSGIYILNRFGHGNSKGLLIGLCSVMILLISISRVYLGVHYPTDIIAGIIGGVFCIILSTVLLKNKLLN